MKSSAHFSVSPVCGSRHLSKSTPVYSACFVKTKPIPSNCPFVCTTRSKVLHVFEAVELAFTPLGCFGSFVGLPSRCSIRQQTQCGSFRSSSGRFSNWFSKILGHAHAPAHRASLAAPFTHPPHHPPPPVTPPL